MNEPKSDENAEFLPERTPSTSYELRLLPDRGDWVGEAVTLPDRGDVAYEMVPLPNPASPPELTDEEIEPPIVRHDPFAYMRTAPWMDRRLSPSGRGAILLRRDLDAFPSSRAAIPTLPTSRPSRSARSITSCRSSSASS